MSDGIIRNSVITLDGTVLNSRNRHDFVSHEDKTSGRRVAVDGGLAYLKRVGHFEDYIENSIHYSHGHLVCREIPVWGTYGKNGDEPLRLVSASQMETSHILAVFNSQKINPTIKQVFEDELNFRKSKKVVDTP